MTVSLARSPVYISLWVSPLRLWIRKDGCALMTNHWIVSEL